MHQSKLLHLLKSLTREEFRRFGQFIRSPYFNTNDRLVTFYDYLNKYYPGLFSPKLEKEKAFAYLFEASAYDDISMRQLMFKMTKLVEKFLMVEEASNKEGESDRLLIQSMGRRNLYPYFKRLLERELVRLEGIKHKDLSALYHLLLYNQQYFFHPDTHKFKAGVQSIEDCMKYLDQYFIQAKMRYSSELMTRMVTLKEEHEIWLLDEVLDVVDENSAEVENALTLLYQKLLRLYSDRKNNALFEAIKKEFVAIVVDIPQTERIELYQQLSNFTVSKINEGNRDFRNDFFDLAKVALTYDMLLDENRITDATFTNLVAIASTLKEFDWTADFIYQYEKRLEVKVRESAVSLAWAYWHYQKNDFAEVLGYLQSVEFLPSYGFRVKSLRLRTYFEMFQKDDAYLDVLMADIHSFELYVRRHSNMNGHRKKTYLNFILYTKKLIKLKTSPNATIAQKNNLTKSIKEKEPLVVKHWLLEKLKDL